MQVADLKNQELWIDGYNVLTSLEAALSGGVDIVQVALTVTMTAKMRGFAPVIVTVSLAFAAAASVRLTLSL